MARLCLVAGGRTELDMTGEAWAELPVPLQALKRAIASAVRQQTSTTTLFELHPVCWSPGAVGRVLVHPDVLLAADLGAN
jgi:hypothetical protein